MNGLQTGKPGVIISPNGEGAMAKDKYQASHEKWKKENMRQYAFRMTKSTESEMISWLEEHKPIQDYIKGLIRADMERHKD